MKKYNRKATMKLAEWAKTARFADNFLNAFGTLLEDGADPTWRASPSDISALEQLLGIGGTDFDDRVWDLLGGVGNILSGGEGLECLPVRMDSIERTSDGKTHCYGLVSLVDVLTKSGMDPELKSRRLAWLLDYVRDIGKLLDPAEWKLESRPDSFVFRAPPLATALRNDMVMFDMLMDRVELTCDERERARIMNLYAEAEDRNGNPVDHFSLETVLHAAVDMMSYASDDTKHRIVSFVIPRLLDNGASPNERDAKGLTPYGVACEQMESTLAGSPELLRPDNPWREFGLRDDRGRLLLARLLEKLVDDLESGIWDPCENDRRDIERREESLEMVLKVYSKYEPQLPQKLADEHRLLFSDCAARIATRYKDETHLVAALVEAGADPRYAVPGRVGAWREAILEGRENPMIDVLFHTPGPNGVSFVETMTEDERNWVKACGCDDVFGEDGVAKSEPEILKSRERLEEEAYILGRM